MGGSEIMAALHNAAVSVSAVSTLPPIVSYSYSNYPQLKSGYMKSPLTLVSGAKPTLSVPACILLSRQKRMLSSPPASLWSRLRPSCRQQVLSSLPPFRFSPRARPWADISCQCPAGPWLSICVWVLAHMTSLPETQEESKNIYFY